MKPESPDAGRLLSSKPVSPQEAADRLAIRELLEAYSHCADRRDARGQMALFTTDTRLMVYMNAKDLKPLQELPSREALARKQPGQTRAKQNERDRSAVSFCYLSGLLGRPH
jgi:SnoaL-like domain